MRRAEHVVQDLGVVEPELRDELQRLLGEPVAPQAIEVEHEHVRAERVEVERVSRVRGAAQR